MARKKAPRTEVVRYHFEEGEPVDVPLPAVVDALLSQLMKLKDLTGNRRPYDDLIKRLSDAQRRVEINAAQGTAARAAAAKKSTRKGAATRDKVCQRYRLEKQHRTREIEIPNRIAKALMLAPGTVRNIIRELRKARRI